MKKLRILTARPHRLFAPVLEDIRRLNKEKIILIVPEQLTVSMEEMLMRSLGVDCLMGIDVISPTKLYQNLIHHIGSVESEPLSSMGVRMAIGQALENTEDKLIYYHRAAHYPGMVEKLSSILTDLKRGGMTPTALKEVSEKTEEPILKAKFADLADIYERYQNVLGSRFHDAEDRMGYLSRSMQKADCLNDKILYIYGFDTITEQLSAMIEGAVSVCIQVNVAMVCDFHAKVDGSLYAPVQESIERLVNRLGGINQVDFIHLNPEPLKNSPEIAYIDTFPVHAAPVPFEGTVSSIECCSAVHPYEEATHMSRKVLKCMQEGISLSGMAVLFPDEPDYRFAISAALSDAGVPFFDNRPMPVLNHPLVSCLLNALRAIESQWSSDRMQPLLESDYSLLLFEEACRLKDYTNAYGIQYKLWEMPFTRGGSELVEEMEPLRIRLMEPLLHCRNALLSSQNAEDSLQAVFTLLMEWNAYDKLFAEVKRLEELSLTQQAEQSGQLWDVLMDLMDETLRLEEEKRIPLSHIADRFENALSAVSLNALPPSGEVLQIGTLDHMIMQEADVVFLMGLNEGLLSRETESLLRPEERLLAEKLGECYLGLTDVSRNLLAELDLRKSMTLPRKKLFLSYSENSSDGSPKEILGLLQKLLEKGFTGKIPIRHGEEEMPLSSFQAEVRLTQASEELLSPKLAELAHRLSFDEEAHFLAELMSYKETPLSLTQEEAIRLYGERYLTISRLESFANCPFKHFIEYGLRPLENREWQIDPRITGDFCHHAMDNFGINAMKLPEYPHISRDKLNRLTEETLLPMIDELRDDLLRDGARNEAVLNRCCDAVRTSIRNVTDQLAQGGYRIWKTEAAFGERDGLPPLILKLPNGKEVFIRGRIDRIDCCPEETGTAIRVIDYKSSGKVLYPGKITFGLQLQLLLYLSVCVQSAPNFDPSGAFYFHVSDPLLENEEDESEKLNAMLKKAFFMNGVRVTEWTDLDGVGIPAPYAATISVTEKQMEKLLKKTREVAVILAERLFDGDTSILPSSFKEQIACEYCSYGLICKRDQRSPAARYHMVDAISDEELLSILNEDSQS